jgi:DNA repair exonuclease SbcCD ATPase subunit
MTPSAIKVAGGQKVWTPSAVEQALRDYTELYGPEWTAAAFSTSSAKWADRQDLVDRYYKGNSLRGGTAWPSLNTIKKIYGSITGARAALGLPANRPGPSKRRAAGAHAPIRDVRERVHTVVVERHADNRLSVEQVARAQAQTTKVKVERVVVAAPTDKRLLRQAERAEGRLAKTVESLREARGKLRDAKSRAEAATRTVKQLQGRLSVAESAAAALRSALDDAEAARSRDGDALAMKLMAEINGRAVDASAAQEREGELLAALVDADARVSELEAVVELVDRDELKRAATEVEQARGKVAEATAAKTDAERVAATAARERRAAVARAEAAERKAASETAQRAKLQEVLVGHARPLTPAQVEALREKGPQGPAIFGDAVKAVVKAQSKGERALLRDALRRAAAAAIGWADRL